jgi:hypothetical protein
VKEGERFSGPLFEGVTAISAPPVNFSGGLENCAQASALQERLRDTVARAFSPAVGKD